MLSPELKNHITNSYAQIDEIVSAVKVDEGYLSQNHLINTQNNRCFLKQYNQRYTIKHIEDVHKVIMYFFKQ